MEPRIPIRALAGVLAPTLVLACADAGTAPEAPRTVSAASEGASGLSVYGPGHLDRAVPDPCPAPGARDFDFWLGSWNVERDGAVVGTDLVTLELDGCVVMEDFINAAGARARGMHAWDAATGLWHQVYQDNLLGNYRLSGTATPDGMELSGEQDIYHFGLQRVVRRDATSTWSGRGDGTVHLIIRGSFDDGPPLVLFESLYRPAPDPDRADPAYFPLCQEVLPSFRQLDFWIGSWAVRAEPGAAAGESRVEAGLNGCLLQHDFRGRNGYLSRSFLHWDFAESRWIRSMADNTGGWVQLFGGLVDGRMVLTGTDETPDGGEIRVRNTIAPDGEDVLETWEVSRDGGQTWQPARSLRYRAR